MKLIKSLLPTGETPRRIPFGLNRGIRLNLDLHYQSQVYFGLYERELSPYFKRLSEGIKTAIDVGASKGIYTLFFLQKTDAHVIAIEPEIPAELQANLALNSFRPERLEIIQEYLGAENRIDRYVTEFAEPCLIKMDIEGAEGAVLPAAEKLLARDRTRWIIEVHSAALLEMCEQLFRKHGYQMKIVPLGWWRRMYTEYRTENNYWLVAAKRSDLPL